MTGHCPEELTTVILTLGEAMEMGQMEKEYATVSVTPT